MKLEFPVVISVGDDTGSHAHVVCHTVGVLLDTLFQALDQSPARVLVQRVVHMPDPTPELEPK